jgi:hypothetical protein
MALLAAILIFVAIIVPLSIWNGFVLEIMWGWFAVPLGAPDITVAHAIGIALLVQMFVSHTSKSDDKSSFLSTILTGFFISLMYLVLGAIIHAFM